MIYVFYLLISALIFIFQSTLCQYIAIAGIKPNFMLIFVVMTAFLKGKEEGLIAGIIIGLFHDCFFGQLIGVNLFLYGIIGYAIGCLTDNFNKENIAAPVLLTFTATFIYDMGFYMLNIILRGYTEFNIYIVLNILPELIYNTIFAFIIYVAVYFISSSSFGRKGHNHRF